MGSFNRGAALAVLLAAAAPATASEPGAPTAEARALIHLHLAHRMSVELAELAGERAHHRGVRALAGRIAHERHEHHLRLMTVAAQCNIRVANPALEGADLAWVERAIADRGRLALLRGTSFDRAFLEAVGWSLQQTLGVLNALRDQVTDLEVAQYLDEVLPELEEHLALAADRAGVTASRAPRQEDGSPGL